MTNETQTFTGLTGNFTTSYGYELSGRLKSVTDAFSDTVYYNNDAAGRTTSITGSSFGGVTSYAGDIEYRAFGGLKQMTYGSSDSSVVSYDYDSALRPVSYEATSSVLSGGFVRKASYEYYNDGSMKKVGNLLNSSMDETYAYDFSARLRSSTSGTAVNGDSETVTPFAQTIGYDEFGNMTSRSTDIWGNDEGGFTATYSNNRKAGGTLDDSGNFVDTTEASNNYSRWKFDASGRNIQTKMAWHLGHVGQTLVDRTDTIDLIRDGDGVSVKRVDTKVGHQLYPDTTTTTTKTEYYVISTVLGGKTLTELDENGGKKRTKIYVGSGIVAEQLVHQSDDTHSTEWEEVLYKHEDIVTGSYQKTTAAGTLAGGNDPPASIEFEPLGGAVPQADPNIEDYGLQPNPLSSFKYFGDVGRSEFGCLVDGHPSDFCFQLLQSGIAVPDRTFEQSLQLGYWVDEDGPPQHPDDPDTIPGGSVQTRFVPFLFGDVFENFRSTDKLSDEACDKHLSDIFGGVARAMENGLDINGVNRNNGYPGHSATPVNDKPLYTWVDLNENGKKDKGEMLKDVDRGGIIHIYTDETASARTDTSLFTPGGWTGAVSYYTGGNPGLIFSYSNGITIEFVHAGTFNKNLKPSIPKNPGMGNLAEIGYVGGAGGEGDPVPIFENGKLTGNSTAGYNHTHIVFFSNKARNTRIDPRTIFCGW